jgi:aspartate/methionine/tyrosine aminotransferase
MRLEPFALERLQSTWEHRVAWNVSESGVHPLRLDELADRVADRDALFEQHLAYTQTNGTVELREAIASLYDGAAAANVQVTNGGSEANWISLWHLVEPGDEVVLMSPNYMQAAGIARAFGASVRLWHLTPEPGAAGQPDRWRADVDALASLVTPRTKLIAICNPNNPTGARFTDAEIDAVCRIAAGVGAWVLSDEIYRGAELDGVDTPTAWARYDRVVITSGLSKAYGLPGLRIGWAAGPPALVEALWGIHDYTTIAPGALNDVLGRIALSPDRRERILARTRGIIATNYGILRRWIDRRQPPLWHAAPEAGAIAFIRYPHRINSTTLVERLRDERSVLAVPGDHFGMDGYLRIGFGGDPLALTRALDHIAEVLDTVPCATGDEMHAMQGSPRFPTRGAERGQGPPPSDQPGAAQGSPPFPLRGAERGEGAPASDELGGVQGSPPSSNASG